MTENTPTPESRLMDSLASLVEWIESGVKAGGQAVVEHAPAVAQQYVAYEFTISLAGVLLLSSGLVLGLTALAVAVFRSSWLIDSPDRYDHGNWPETRIVCFGLGCLVAFASSLVLATSPLLPALIKAHTAPMVLVLEKVSSLL